MSSRWMVLGFLLILFGCASPTGPAPYTPWTGDGGADNAATASIVSPSQLPRVMLIVDEKSLGTIATAEVESMAIRKLQAMNVAVVDQDMVRATLARGQQLLQMAGDNRGAAALGLQFGAEVVLVGEAVSKPAASRIADSNLRAYQAVVTLRAVRTDNAATLTAVSEDASVVALEDVGGSAKALRAAAEKSLDKLIPELAARWRPGAAQTGGEAVYAHRIELLVGGVDQLWKLKALRDNFRGRDAELRNLVQRSYAAGAAEFSADSALPAEELAEALVLRPPAGLRLQVLDVAAGRVQLRVTVPEPKTP
jgi:hypothetical protein